MESSKDGKDEIITANRIVPTQTIQIYFETSGELIPVKMFGNFGIFYLLSRDTDYIPAILNAIISRKPKHTPGVTGYSKTNIKWQIFSSPDNNLRVIFQLVE